MFLAHGRMMLSSQHQQKKYKGEREEEEEDERSDSGTDLMSDKKII
jgi:hypothetical protein